jgi:citrate lyase subunit alpha/citrate CoA-transferase
MKVTNSAGRIVENEISGVKYEPFKGAKKHVFSSKVTSLKEALKKCNIKDGVTVSFHHQLRNGDFVINMTLDAIKELGIKNIRMAQTAMFNVHEPVIDFIIDGTISRIEGSINGSVGDFISKNPLDYPVVLRSHGGRWAAVKSGELNVDIAIVAASAADVRGNCTGVVGDSAFGPISYSQVDAMNANYVIIVTDNIIDYPCRHQEIQERHVDCVVDIDKVGDPDKIVSGSLKITEDPMKQKIARDCIEIMDAAGIIKDGMVFQSGAGGISLAAVKYLGERLQEKDVVAATATGGLTKFIIDIYKQGRVKNLYSSQVFDVESVKFIQENLDLPAEIGHYAARLSKGRTM